MAATQEELEFAIVLSEEIEGQAFQVALLAHKLMRAATILHMQYEAVCNEQFASEPDYQKSIERKEEEVLALLAPYTMKIKVRFNHDPRGASIMLKLAGGKSNDFGGEGYYCVPCK